MTPVESDSHTRTPPETDGLDQGAPAGAAHQSMLPLPVFLAFLRRLHEGPPQHAATVRVAIAIWQAAVDRDDTAQAKEAAAMVRTAVDGLITSMTALQETGRRWSGIPSPTMVELEAAERMAEAWQARYSQPGGGGDTPTADRSPA